jgi:hypothetical protein
MAGNFTGLLAAIFPGIAMALGDREKSARKIDYSAF